MVLNAVGTMGEVVVLGWLALELTSSPFLVGVALGMRALPLFFVGAPAGVLADRFPRHRLLMLTGAGQALTASALGALTLAGRVRFAHLLLLTLVAGVIRGVEWAARQSYTHDVVGPKELINALALLGVAMRAGWLVGSRGPVRGGGTRFLVVLLAFGASLVTLGAAPRVVGYAGVVIVLVAVNALGAVSDLLSQSLMQLGVPERLRGRAGGAWVVAIGLAPLGQLQIGALASLFGVGIALGASGLALTALARPAALTFSL